MQCFCAIPRVPFDGLPHDDIRSAQMLERLVRRPVFINGPRAQLKKDRGGNGTLLATGNGNHTEILGQNLLENVPKKNERLRGQAVFLAGFALQQSRILLSPPDFVKRSR